MLKNTIKKNYADLRMVAAGAESKHLGSVTGLGGLEVKEQRHGRKSKIADSMGPRHMEWNEAITNPHCQKSFQCWSPYRAFSVSCPDCMQLTLHHETFVKHEDEDGHTPLMGAARVGQPAILTILIKQGCSPDAVNAYGRTAADFAAKYGRFSPPLSVCPQLTRLLQVWTRRLRASS